MTKEEFASNYAEHNLGLCTNEFGNIYHAVLVGFEEAEKHKIKRQSKMDMFYKICKFILCLCSTIIILLYTIALIYVAF